MRILLPNRLLIQGVQEKAGHEKDEIWGREEELGQQKLMILKR